jgi:hypothetical protein
MRLLKLPFAKSLLADATGEYIGDLIDKNPEEKPLIGVVLALLIVFEAPIYCYAVSAILLGCFFAFKPKLGVNYDTRV